LIIISFTITDLVKIMAESAQTLERVLTELERSRPHLVSQAERMARAELCAVTPPLLSLHLTRPEVLQVGHKKFDMSTICFSQYEVVR
jgi:hypothetical protein